VGGFQRYIGNMAFDTESRIRPDSATSVSGIHDGWSGCLKAGMADDALLHSLSSSPSSHLSPQPTVRAVDAEEEEPSSQSTFLQALLPRNLNDAFYDTLYADSGDGADGLAPREDDRAESGEDPNASSVTGVEMDASTHQLPGVPAAESSGDSTSSQNFSLASPEQSADPPERDATLLTTNSDSPSQPNNAQAAQHADSQGPGLPQQLERGPRQRRRHLDYGTKDFPTIPAFGAGLGGLAGTVFVLSPLLKRKRQSPPDEDLAAGGEEKAENLADGDRLKRSRRESDAQKYKVRRKTSSKHLTAPNPCA